MAPQSSSPLRLALIGMSGAGKTFWTKRLAQSGCPSFSCDEGIEHRLSSSLSAGGYAGINGVAAWMGWPDSKAYAEREAKYLAQEMAVLDETLAELERDASRELILDTTGSVIYTGTNLLRRLRKQMTVVYLAASEQEQEILKERYLTNPKPVLWRGAFQPRLGENPRDTAARCYPALIAARRGAYEALAHCTLLTADLRHSSPDANGFLAMVRNALQLLERK
jgi:shikimate kinase